MPENPQYTDPNQDAYNTIKAYIEDVGYTSSIILEARLPYHRSTIDRVLSSLWHAKEIERPLKGFVLSTKWAKQHPKLHKELERKFCTHIPIREHKGD